MRSVWRRVQRAVWRSRRAWELVRLYWDTPDYDWSTIALLMRHQIRRTRLHMQEHGLAADADRKARQMLIAETLLGRMLDDSCYYEMAARRYPYQVRARADLTAGLYRQDAEMLATVLRRRLRSWWD